MILVIPKIILKCGESELLINSEDTKFLSICKDPIKLLTLLRKENAKTLLISDKESLCNENNLLNINTILYFQNCIDIPIEFETNILDKDDCCLLLENGIYRLFLSDIIYVNFDSFIELINIYKNSRIGISLIYHDNYFYTYNESKYSLEDLINLMKTSTCKRILLKLNENDNDKFFEILDKFGDIFKQNNLSITINYDIDDYKQLIKLNDYVKNGFDSIVIGKPFYENKFSCQKIWRTIESELEILN